MKESGALCNGGVWPVQESTKSYFRANFKMKISQSGQICIIKVKYGAILCFCAKILILVGKWCIFKHFQGLEKQTTR